MLLTFLHIRPLVWTGTKFPAPLPPPYRISHEAFRLTIQWIDPSLWWWIYMWRDVLPFVIVNIDLELAWTSSNLGGKPLYMSFCDCLYWVNLGENTIPKEVCEGTLSWTGELNWICWSHTKHQHSSLSIDCGCKLKIKFGNIIQQITDISWNLTNSIILFFNTLLYRSCQNKIKCR